MKRIPNIKTTHVWLSVVLVLGMALAGCSQFLLPEIQEAKPVLSDETDLTRSVYLALLKTQNNHKVSLDELSQIVDAVLNTTQGGRSIAPSGSTITGVKKVPLAGENRFALSGSGRSIAVGAEEEPVEVYEFAIESTSGGNIGFVLASNDVRIGNILAIGEGSLADTNENFLAVLQANLEDYIASTIREYDSITEAEIEAAIEAAIAAESTGARALANHWEDGFNLTGAYAYKSNFRESKPPLLKTKWGQGEKGVYSADGYAYNNYVKQVRNTSTVTGCVPTAMAQIIAYHNYIKYVSSYIPQPFFNNLGDWMMTYNLSKIRTMEKITNSSPSHEKAQVAVLMHQIGKLGGAVYQDDLTTMDFYPATQVFTTLGYSIAYATNATLLTETSNSSTITYIALPSTIRGALENYRPIFAYGYPRFGTVAHAWVIDGYGEITQYVEYFYNSGTNQYSTVTITLNNCLMVHCNLGWDGRANGWYVYGIFDTRNRTLIEKSDDYSDSNYDFSTNTTIIIPMKP